MRFDSPYTEKGNHRRGTLKNIIHRSIYTSFLHLRFIKVNVKRESIFVYPPNVSRASFSVTPQWISSLYHTHTYNF